MSRLASMTSGLVFLLKPLQEHAVVMRGNHGWMMKNSHGILVARDLRLHT
jgi:hypothetical protein